MSARGADHATKLARDGELVDKRLDITVDSTVRVRVPTLFLDTRVLRSVRAADSEKITEDRIEAACARWSQATENRLDTHPHVQVYRELVRRLGGDPEENVPATEALIRRGLLQNRFPRVNLVVDAGNVASVEHLVPIGLFDCERIVGEVTLTLAGDEDCMIPIGKSKPTKLPIETPVLKDDGGVFSAVGTRDSRRTMITPETTSVFVFSWGMEGVDPDTVAAALDQYADTIGGLTVRAGGDVTPPG